MDQPKEQAKQEYAKYDTVQGYAPVQPNLSQPPYGQMQPYPAQYAPAARRDRGPIPLLLIAASLVIIVLGISAWLSFFQHGQDYSRRMPIVAGTTLHINANGADLKLVTSEKPDNTATFSGRNLASFDLKQSGNDITLEAKEPQQLVFGSSQSQVEVTVPPNVSLDLDTGSGHVQIDKGGASGGQVKVQTGSGEIKANNLQGGNISLHTGSGDINVEGAQGSLDLQTGSGEIKVGGAKPDKSLTMQTGSGDIDYSGNLASSTNVQTGSGEVKLRIPETPPFYYKIDTGSGDINGDFGISGDKHAEGSTATDFPNLPSLTVRTGSGDINIEKGQ